MAENNHLGSPLSTFHLKRSGLEQSGGVIFHSDLLDFGHDRRKHDEEIQKYSDLLQLLALFHHVFFRLR
jgi:hypothetical protein